MKSNKAKVLHEIFFAPMIQHVIDALESLSLREIIAVVGHQRQEVESALQGSPVSFAYQEEQLGTGHAVLAAGEKLAGKEGTVLILCGDTPLIRTDTLRTMLDQHAARGAKLTVMTTTLEDPTNYGRIVVDPEGNILAVVEEKDATAEQRLIKEVNAGIYCAEIGFLYEALPKIGTDNKQGEVYLTDIVEITNKSGLPINRFLCPDPEEVLGVNSRVELAVAHARLQERRNREFMTEGVTLLGPESIWIGKGVTIGTDTVIHPNVHISGQTVIGKGCVIEPFTVMRDCQLGNEVTIGAFSYLEGSRIKSGASLAPRTMELPRNS